MTSTRPYSAIVEQCADEMVADWTEGRYTLTEQFLDRFHGFADSPEAALELLAEELTLREEFNLPTTLAELESRFPTWKMLVRALWECQRVLGPQLVPPRFPELDESLGDFQLQKILGRGSHGRVYLATQPDLADRPVVLKVSPMTGHEHLALAQLQHTNIVPLYSVQDLISRRLRVLCMPYFGGCTLESLLESSSRIRSGRDLFACVSESNVFLPSMTCPGPVRGFLEQATLSEAVCWMAAGLADALQHAHDRGLLHLDLKPSNLLISADGVPMLLDFHLAQSPIPAGQPAPAWLGGTPEFMAPEHRDAIEAVRSGARIETGIDARADIYSLGLVIRQFLSATRTSMSCGLNDILDRCTSPQPRGRYVRAADLAADLRRHLSDLPLRGVRNRSLMERWQKWRRRRPYAFPLALCLLALAVGGIRFGLSTSRNTRQAEQRILEARTLLAEKRPDPAKKSLETAETLLEGVPFASELRAEVRALRVEAERIAAVTQLHEFAERVRFLAVAETLTREQRRSIEAECDAIRTRRSELSSLSSVSPVVDQDLDDIVQVGTMMAGGMNAPIAKQPNRPDQEILGLWDRVMAARRCLAANHAEAAVTFLEVAVRESPDSFWANYYHGVALLRCDRASDALASFTACKSLAPRAAWCRYNCGLAYRKLNRNTDALHEFDQALRLDPTLWPALWERAAVRPPKQSLEDLTLSLERGAPRPETEYRMALVHLMMNQRSAARALLQDCLTLEPGHIEAAATLQKIR